LEVIKRILLLGAVALLAAVPTARTVVADNEVAGVDSKTLARIEEIARTYAKLGRVDDQARFAPYLCSMPQRSEPRVSRDHGPKKIYYLYASSKKDGAYFEGRYDEVDYVVKESFACADEATKKAGAKTGLFVVLRAPRGVESDEGWLYATTTADGKVTSAGQIASCIRCHKLAPHERLFGLDGKKRAADTKKETAK
jgi:hypothetical protein